MPLMDSLITTTTPAPPKMIVYGQPGVGKTTFAASADAVLIDCENGAGAVPGLKRTPYLQTWPQMREWLVEIATAPPDDASGIAVDTIDWMIQRIIEHVVLDLDGKSAGNITNTLGTAHGGYFKAREIAQNIVYRDLLPLLNAVTDNGMAVILLAHAANTKMTAPEGFDLRLAAPDLPQWIAPPFIEWADAVLYASRDGDERKLLTQGTNVILAKNRYDLPAELPLSWPALMQALTHDPDPVAPTNLRFVPDPSANNEES
ncbi:MAG TPA: ATP-binding protein [Phycisphaerae bacterium]|nr:ATP-binding protein [Phycisphaerae bacterium]